MRVCNTEAMKIIKELEEQKRMMLGREVEASVAVYKEGEEKIAEDYDYSKTRKQIRETDDRIRHIRVALAASNCKTKIDGFDITITEALVLLAQLQTERMNIDLLGNRRRITRRITANGVVEYTECLYDIQKANDDAKALRKKISDLQMAIDRANLNAYIDI